MYRMSLSARRAWIEIRKMIVSQVREQVALRKESVDRNLVMRMALISYTVALRKESVDRNNSPHGQKNINRVALRKESVDRNLKSVGD